MRPRLSCKKLSLAMLLAMALSWSVHHASARPATAEIGQDVGYCARNTTKLGACIRCCNERFQNADQDPLYQACKRRCYDRFAL